MNSETNSERHSNDKVFVTKKEKPKIGDLKDVAVFGDTTLSDIMKEIYTRTTDQHTRALDVFDKIAAEVDGVDNIFIIGEKASPYLDIAQKSTDNMIKMLSVGQKIIEASGAQSIEDEFDPNSIIDLLEKEEILPEEFKNRNSKEKSKKKDESKIQLELPEKTEEEKSGIQNRIKIDDSEFQNIERYKKEASD